MNEELTVKAAAPVRRSALRKAIAVMVVMLLALLLGGRVYWTTGNERQGEVELGFEGYKWEKSSSGEYLVAKFRLMNNSGAPVSFLGIHKSFLEVEILKANSTVALNPMVRCGIGVGWHSILPGEELTVESYIGEVEVPWQAEFRYVPGLVSTWEMGKEPRPDGDIKFANQIQKSDWATVRSATALPTKIGPVILVGK